MFNYNVITYNYVIKIERFYMSKSAKIYELHENDGQYLLGNRNKVQSIVVHCTANSLKKGVALSKAAALSIFGVFDVHLANNFKTIGYHYIIYPDGTIYKGRYDNETGEHVGKPDYTYNGMSITNGNSIGVCYYGGLIPTNKRDSEGKIICDPCDTRTKEQKAALVLLLYLLKRKFPKSVVLGHRDLKDKACPSFDAKTEYRWISNGELPSGQNASIFTNANVNPNTPYKIDVLDYGFGSFHHMSKAAESKDSAAKRGTLAQREAYIKQRRELAAREYGHARKGSGIGISINGSKTAGWDKTIMENPSARIDIAQNLKNNYHYQDVQTSNNDYISFDFNASRESRSSMEIANIRQI